MMPRPVQLWSIRALLSGKSGINNCFIHFFDKRQKYVENLFPADNPQVLMITTYFRDMVCYDVEWTRVNKHGCRLSITIFVEDRPLEGVVPR